MGRTVAELMETLSARELQQWQAFDRINPIGDERIDLLIGIMTASLINSQPGRKRKFKASDFMPFVTDDDRKNQLGQDIRKAFAQFKKG
jgi:hypothetical protein